ncbi:transcription factor MYBS1-like [Wolffia australiana]
MAGWSREEDKAFEVALATALPFEEEEEARWEEIAAKVPGKTAMEVKAHYQDLIDDLRAIDAGKVPIPAYVGLERDRDKDLGQAVPGGGEKKGVSLGGSLDSGHGKGGSKAEQERRKGIPWTEEEHKLFLLGLDKFGKGDWRSISRNFVISRTPTQVASHAQKYFIRLNSMNRDRRRASIHDITSVTHADLSSPITGQPAMAPPAKPLHPLPHPNSMAIFAPPAMGTPVIRPPTHPPYVFPVAYPVPPPTMNP